MSNESVLTISGLTLEEYNNLKRGRSDMYYLIQSLNRCFEISFEKAVDIKQKGEQLTKQIDQLRHFERCHHFLNDAQREKLDELTAQADSMEQQYKDALLTPKITINLDDLAQLLLSSTVRDSEYGIRKSQEEKEMRDQMLQKGSYHPKNVIFVLTSSKHPDLILESKETCDDCGEHGPEEAKNIPDNQTENGESDGQDS